MNERDNALILSLVLFVSAVIADIEFSRLLLFGVSLLLLFGQLRFHREGDE